MNLLNPKIKPGSGLWSRLPEQLRGKHIGLFPIIVIVVIAVLVFGVLIYSFAERIGGESSVEVTQVDNLTASSGAEEIIVESKIKLGEQSFADLGIESVVQEELVLESLINNLNPEVSPLEPRVDNGSVLEGVTDGVLHLEKFENDLVEDERRTEALKLGRAASTEVDLNSYNIKEAVEQVPTPRDISGIQTPESILAANQAALVNALKAQNNGEGGSGGDDANLQNNKSEFIDDGVSSDGYIKNKPKRPKSPFEIKAGWLIPAIMITEVNSDLPGWAIAQVSENVYDSATGELLLIPQGSRLLGVYDAQIAFGQKRSLIVWNRLIFPNGVSLELGRMVAGDQSGATGLRDKVNSHNIRIFGSVLLLSLFQGAPDLLEDKKQVTDGDRDSELERLAATNVTDLAGELTRRNLARQPTLIIGQGFEFNVLVHKDMVFLSEYRY